VIQSACSRFPGRFLELISVCWDFQILHDCGQHVSLGSGSCKTFSQNCSLTLYYTSRIMQNLLAELFTLDRHTWRQITHVNKRSSYLCVKSLWFGIWSQHEWQLFWVTRITRFSWRNYCTFELQYDDTRATTFVAARHCHARKPQLPPTALSRAPLSVPRVNWITGHASIESPSGSKMLPPTPRRQSPCAPDLRSTDGHKELRRARKNHGCSDSFSYAQRSTSFYNCVGEIFYHNHGENLYHGAADIICCMWFQSSDQLPSIRK